MSQSESINEIIPALVKAQAAMKCPAPNSRNPHYKSDYADLSEFIKEARKPLTDNGIAFVQSTRVEGDVPILVTTIYHTSGQWISGEYPLLAAKNDPQGLGSAMTYARRYTMAAILGLAKSDDDDDGYEAGKKATDVRPAQRPANGVAPAKTPTNGTPKPAAAPAQPANRIFAYRAVQNWSGGQDGPKPIVTSQDWENYHNDIMHDANEAKKALWLGPQGQKQVLANLAGAVSKRHPHVSGIQYTDMGAALTAWDTMANNLARECRNHGVQGPTRPEAAAESMAVAGEPE